MFTAPIRPTLKARTYEEASGIRRKLEGKGVTRQAFGITPKIVEVDSFLIGNPDFQAAVQEVHPEVSFYYLNHRRPMSCGKKKSKGRHERVAALSTWRAADEITAMLDRRRELKCESDDILDALVALWSAERISKGIATSISEPAVDRHGLRIQITA